MARTATVRKPADEQTSLEILEAALASAQEDLEEEAEFRVGIEAELVAQLAAKEVATQKLAGLNAARPDLLPAGDDADIEESEAEITRATRAIERAETVIVDLEQRVARAKACEARAADARVVAEANCLAARRPALAATYRQQSAALAETLNEMARIESIIDRANEIIAATKQNKPVFIDAGRIVERPTPNAIAGVTTTIAWPRIPSLDALRRVGRWSPPALLEEVRLPRFYEGDVEVWTAPAPKRIPRLG